MTTRPQLASSPAIAVLTSGELAIDMRDAARRLLRHRALDHDLDELARAFAVARHLFGEIGQHGVERFAERHQARVAGAGDARRAARAAPVAKASSVSEVEVSPSMVTALKVSVDAFAQQRLQRRRARSAHR